MEFNIGEHCQLEECNQLDFLPFKCDLCKKIFCLKHKSYDDHKCEVYELQKKIHDYGIESFKLISISVDPENDTPQRLKEYAIRNGVDLSNWEFLTGSEEEIYDLAQSGFHIAAAQDSLAPGGVFHSADITIVDDRGYIRTGLDKKKNIKFVYDGTSTTDIKLLVGEIQRLTITDFKDNYEIKQK